MPWRGKPRVSILLISETLTRLLREMVQMTVWSFSLVQTRTGTTLRLHSLLHVLMVLWSPRRLRRLQLQRPLSL